MLRPGRIWGQSYTQVFKASNALNFFVKYWDRYSGSSKQFAIAADKHRLGILYVKCKLFSIQIFSSCSRQIFIKSILKIFYVRGVAVQNSYVRIKVLTALGRSFMQTRKSKGPRMLPCGTP